MARYIDADRDSFPTLHQKELNDYMKGWNACLKSVLQQPTADVVEVVRCCECKYQITHTCRITGVKTLFCDYGEKPVTVEPTHFCSYGERREG